MTVDPQWYRKIWTLDVRDQPWVEQTERETDFIVEALALTGGERILDLACGFGRHSLALARRGYRPVGVDITPAYIDEARRAAAVEQLPVEFVCADLRQVSFKGEFDVVLNLADGAIGYLENDEENLRVFDLIAAALNRGGRHLMAVCNGAFARKHFPCRHWELGGRALSLVDFAWEAETSRMLRASCAFRYGEPLAPPDRDGSVSCVRLYTLDELLHILQARGMTVRQAYGDYAAAVAASDDRLSLLVQSTKSGRVPGSATRAARPGRRATRGS